MSRRSEMTQGRASSAPGFIGRAWAITFARAGHEVALWDEVKDAPATGGRLHPRRAAGSRGQRPPQRRGRRRRCSPTSRSRTTSTAALAGADHVQENTPERLEMKRAIFARLDALAPAGRGPRLFDLGDPAVDASPRRSPGRHRCLVVHPINPPYLIPAVEVVPAPWTVARDRGARRAPSSSRSARRRS